MIVVKGREGELRGFVDYDSEIGSVRNEDPHPQGSAHNGGPSAAVLSINKP